MDAILDAAVQLVQMTLLLALVAQNFAFGKRLRAIEEKLSR